MPAPDYAAFKDEFDRVIKCAHPRTELRVHRDRSGRAHAANQCLVCGKRDGEFVSRSALGGRSIADLPAWDEALEEYGRYGADERRRKAWDEIKSTAIKKRKADYDAYLCSPGWAAKRQKVIRRAGGLCEGSRERKAAHAHHTTYDHIFDEFLFELIALCKQCHTRIHPEASRRLENTSMLNTQTSILKLPNDALQRTAHRLENLYENFTFESAAQHVLVGGR